MQFLKNSFGIKAFLLCWILVLLVPNWRQNAGWQWQSANLDYDLYNQSMALDKRNSSEIASQFPDDWQLQLEALRIHQTVRNNEAYEVPQAPTTQEEMEASNARLTQRIRDNTDRFIAEYKALSQKFPSENEIRKSWILASMRGSINREPTPENSGVLSQKGPISIPGRKILIQCTIDGAKLEPKNSFFPLMQTVYLFSLGREDEAISAIRRAAQCDYFDDGTQQTPIRQIELLSRSQHVTWFQKHMAVWSVLLPHFSSFYVTQEAAMEVANKKQKRGEKLAALQIAYDLQRIGETFLNRKQFLISASQGRNMIVCSWAVTLENAGLRKKSELNISSQEYRGLGREKMAQAFAQYAHDLGREDIAKSAIRLDRRLQKYDGYREFAYLEGQNGADFTYLTTTYWAQSLLIKMALAGAICWFVGLPFTRKLEFKTLSQRRALFSWAAFCAGTTIVFFVVAIYFYGAGSFTIFDAGYNPEATEKKLAFEKIVPYALAFIWLVPIAILTIAQYVTHYLSRREKPISLHWKPAMLGTLHTVIFILAVALLFVNDGSGDKIAFLLTYWLPQLFIFFISVFIATIFHLLNSTGKNRIVAALFWGGVWFAILFFYLVSFDSELPTLISAFVSVVLFFFASMIHVRKLVREGAIFRWTTSFHFPNFLPDFAYRVATFAAVLGVLTSVSYILLNLAAIPPVTRMNVAIDHQLEIGELAWLEEQKQAKLAPSRHITPRDDAM